MSESGDPDEKRYKQILNHLAEMHEPKPLTVPFTEKELYDAAFGEAGDRFPLDLQGEPIACESVFEGGARTAAMALLAVAIKGGLPIESLATLRQVYDAINPDAERGDFRAEIKLRRPGRKRPDFKAQMRQKIDDATTAALVRFAERKFGKKEAAVAYIADLKRVSRAEIFRALARNASQSEDEESQDSGD